MRPRVDVEDAGRGESRPVRGIWIDRVSWTNPCALFRATWPGYVRNMSVVPEVSTATAESVRIVGETGHRMVLAHGVSVEVLASYPVRSDADLYSLAEAVRFRCGRCGDPCEATLVAVRDHCLLCPSCYGALGAVHVPSGAERPEQCPEPLAQTPGELPAQPPEVPSAQPRAA